MLFRSDSVEQQKIADAVLLGGKIHEISVDVCISGGDGGFEYE